jgi:hypothetical protein
VARLKFCCRRDVNLLGTESLILFEITSLFLLRLKYTVSWSTS